VAHFDKAIPPGGEGKIKLSIRTRGYQGAIQKSAKVYTNDPKNPLTRLSLKAFVKVPIYLSSRYVYLYGKEGEAITRVIEVRAELDRPLTLTPYQFNLAEKLIYSIEEIEPGKRFRIHFKTIPTSPQTYRGLLKLKTNYPEKPEITLWIRGRVQGTAPARKQAPGQVQK
jgi:hypothetical protein